MTELYKRLTAMVSTTAFRLATGTVAIFLVIAALLLGILFWQTNSVLTDQVITTLTAEAEALRAEAQSGGQSGLVDAVAARSRPEGPGLYYLADAAGKKLAGNLSRSPPEILPDRQGGVFRYRPNVTSASRERLGVALSIAMPRGERLVIGRDIEDQRAFADGGELGERLHERRVRIDLELEFALGRLFDLLGEDPAQAVAKITLVDRAAGKLVGNLQGGGGAGSARDGE